jgi:acid phosphatase type 7
MSYWAITYGVEIMFACSRRAFMGASLGGLAGGQILRADEPTRPEVKEVEDPPFQPNTLFLTWQRDPTTTMTVQWIGVAGETPDTSVYYAKDQKGPWKNQKSLTKPYPFTDYKVYRAELTGLEAGCDYWFRIGSHSPKYRFRTMPAKAVNPINFISGGDCGVNAHTIANNIQAARQDPMFAIVGGDLGYDNGRSVDVSLAFIRNYSKHMIGKDGRLIPMITCIGNHEVDGGYGKPRSQAPFFYALFDGLFTDAGYASLDFGDYLSIVLLDTAHTTPIEGEQTEWLEETLEERKDHPNVMVVNHVPAYPSFRNYQGSNEKEGTGEGNRKHWVPLFEKYRVPVVLEHHDHTFKRTKPLLNGLVHDNGVLYLGDGSWGRLRNPKTPDQLAYLARSSKDYHLSLHRIQGDERFHLALDENGRVMDVSRTGQRKGGSVRITG